MHRIALICLIAACSGSSSSSSGSASPTPPAPAPAPNPDPTTTPAPSVDPARLGQPCAEGGTCERPLECVKYYGIAGPRGPQFSSCEIPCAEDKTACPAGTSCTTIADGPGAVCRPSAK